MDIQVCPSAGMFGRRHQHPPDGHGYWRRQRPRKTDTWKCVNYDRLGCQPYYAWKGYDQECDCKKSRRLDDEPFTTAYRQNGRREEPSDWEDRSFYDYYHDYVDRRVQQAPPEVRIPYRYYGSLCWKTYRNHFDTVAAASGWSSEEKAQFLVASLDGDALSSLRDLRRAGGLFSYSKLVLVLERDLVLGGQRNDMQPSRRLASRGVIGQATKQGVPKKLD